MTDEDEEAVMNELESIIAESIPSPVEHELEPEKELPEIPQPKEELELPEIPDDEIGCKLHSALNIYILCLCVCLKKYC